MVNVSNEQLKEMALVCLRNGESIQGGMCKHFKDYPEDCYTVLRLKPSESLPLDNTKALIDSILSDKKVFTKFVNQPKYFEYLDPDKIIYLFNSRSSDQLDKLLNKIIKKDLFKLKYFIEEYKQQRDLDGQDHGFMIRSNQDNLQKLKDGVYEKINSIIVMGKIEGK